MGLCASTLTKIIDRHTREVTVSHSKLNLKPWVTPGLVRCMHHRNCLLMRAKVNPKYSVINLIYTRCRNFYIGPISKIKNDYAFRLLLQNKGNAKSLWRTIKSVCHLTVKNKEPTELLSVSGG